MKDGRDEIQMLLRVCGGRRSLRQSETKYRESRHSEMKTLLTMFPLSLHLTILDTDLPSDILAQTREHAHYIPLSVIASRGNTGLTPGTPTYSRLRGISKTCHENWHRYPKGIYEQRKNKSRPCLQA